MVVTSGADHWLHCVNYAFCEIQGKEAPELLGHPISEFIPQSIVDGLLDRIYLGAETGTLDALNSKDHARGLAYTAWSIAASDTTANGLVITIEDCEGEQCVCCSHGQANDEMREINEKLVISSVRQHELTELVAQAEVRLRDYAVILECQNAALESANATLQELATTDSLTGLKNARVFQHRMQEEVERSNRYRLPLSLILMDVDYFKQFNDAFGHPAGDLVLEEIGRILQSCARPSDCVARYGGEEFALILPQTDAEGASQVAERIRAAIHDTPWEKRPITASFGIAAMPNGGQPADVLTAFADKALYRAKATGRDCVCLHSHDSSADL